MTQVIARGRFAVTQPEELPSGGVIRDGAVLVQNGKIEAVGTYQELRHQCPDASEIGSDRHLLIPGLINAHLHGRGLSPLQLGLKDDNLDDYIIDYMALKPLDPYLDTLFNATKLIRSGVTCVQHSAIARNPDNIEQETLDVLRAYQDSGLRASFASLFQDKAGLVFRDEQDFIDSLPDDLGRRVSELIGGLSERTTESSFELLSGLLEKYKDHPLIRIATSPTGIEYCTDELIRRAAAFAKDHDIGVHMHCDETAKQHDTSYQRFGKSSVEHLHELGVLGPKTSLAHGTWLNQRDIEICAETGTTICNNASCNLRLRAGIAPVSRMVAEGVSVAIGTDSFGLNNDEDFLQEIRLVANLHRMPSWPDTTGYPNAYDVFRMATINGAKASGMDDVTGSLEVGKQADLLLLNFDAMTAPYVDPSLHPVDCFIGFAKPQHVDIVMVSGKVLYENGRLTRIDEEALMESIKRIASAKVGPELEEFIRSIKEVRRHVANYYQAWQWQKPVNPRYTPNTRG